MMIIKRSHGYGSKRKYIHGKGFVDSLRNIGSYVFQNKDLIAKPLLGAVGNLAATGLTEGTKALVNRIISKNTRDSQLDSKSHAILQNILGGETATLKTEPEVGNIIGSGARGRTGGARGRTGGGIKTF